MSKKFSFEFEPLTYDQLKEMTMEELQLNTLKFKRMIREARKSGMDTAPFEVEFCYLDNERQVRSKHDRNNNRGR